ncbi:PIN domain-containing protein [Rhodococcus sp. USK13]|uniref:PIN domain-containing protein n=1 Tax=Rhodococcus sp. USK13 TaxID=2806442 RepID=UPI001BCB84B0|nr:PIN domain-containing protein [Rhodococcus sp. USK13]
MKSVFPEWYEPDADEIAAFVMTGTIVLDTNVLFSLYRVNNKQRFQVLEVLRSVAGRLWIPYQVGLEYQRGRLDRITEQEKAYGDLNAEIIKLKAKAENTIRDPEIRDQVAGAIQQFASEMETLLGDLHKTHSIRYEDARHDDPVRNALDSMLGAESIGSKPADLNDRQERARKRIDSRTPPGYKDSDKKQDPTGDVLIWFELLDLAKSADSPVLFVTDDVKEDWYRRSSGKVVGPRTELRAEWASTGTTVPYHQTTLRSLLQYAKEHLSISIDDETITSVTPPVASETASLGSLISRLRHPSRSEEIARLLRELPEGKVAHATLVRAVAMMQGGREPEEKDVQLALWLVENQQKNERALLDDLRSFIEGDPDDSGRQEKFRRVRDLLLNYDDSGLLSDPNFSKVAESLRQDKNFPPSSL